MPNTSDEVVDLGRVFAYASPLPGPRRLPIGIHCPPDAPDTDPDADMRLFSRRLHRIRCQSFSQCAGHEPGWIGDDTPWVKQRRSWFGRLVSAEFLEEIGATRNQRLLDMFDGTDVIQRFDADVCVGRVKSARFAPSGALCVYVEMNQDYEVDSVMFRFNHDLLPDGTFNPDGGARVIFDGDAADDDVGDA